ncbi:TonB family C-terminal domain-containing protein [Catalinimonas alkaloidigena]|uniref:TonB family C-terminal domain-containing protein n=1 Tax=Catalinimonas alkaloidigena TaxID=1075417 RepID=A0A1G9RIT2_9BACT|nr:energy transducer TonB [Catalinimonas alkaloidigena]SDM23134.1 TonB family C-terminal domain-containing protein [Catalinimonas alkaloidigena]
MKTQRYKVMLEEDARPDAALPDAEIEPFRNFDELLRRRRLLLVRQRWIRGLLSLGGVALLAGGLWWILEAEAPSPVASTRIATATEEKPPVTSPANEPELPSEMPEASLAATPDSLPGTEAPTARTAPPPRENRPTPQVKAPRSESELQSQAVPSETSSSQPQPSAALPAASEPDATEGTFVEAAPTGGYPALYQFFEAQLQYPESARRDGIAGSVLVEFKINAAGKAEQIHVLKGISPELDQEAVRLVKLMPAWQPARLNGKPMLTRHTIPFNFQLD